MKKNIVFLLLLSFIYQNTSSFWILTSFYIQQDYIANNICVDRFEKKSGCNGNCYLQTELSADAEQQQQFPSFKTQEMQPLFLQDGVFETDLVKTFFFDRIPSVYQVNFHESNWVYALYHPPEWV